MSGWPWWADALWFTGCVVITGFNSAGMVRDVRRIRRSRRNIKELDQELLGEGRFLHRGVMDRRHTCKTPSCRRRKMDDMWQCYCGQAWIWSDHDNNDYYFMNGPRWTKVNVNESLPSPTPVILRPKEIVKLVADGRITIPGKPKDVP